jgi:hypothetical protein
MIINNGLLWERFHEGDSLIFNYQYYHSQFHDFRQVSLAGFDSSTRLSPIATYSNGSDTLLALLYATILASATKDRRLIFMSGLILIQLLPVLLLARLQLLSILRLLFFLGKLTSRVVFASLLIKTSFFYTMILP